LKVVLIVVTVAKIMRFAESIALVRPFLLLLLSRSNLWKKTLYYPSPPLVIICTFIQQQQTAKK